MLIPRVFVSILVLYGALPPMAVAQHGMPAGMPMSVLLPVSRLVMVVI